LTAAEAPAPDATSEPESTRGSGFGRLWFSAGASNLADGVLFAGLPILALQVTESPALIAGVAVALQLPMALGALPAGVLADRVDRRRLLVGVNVLRGLGLLAATVAVLAGELHLAIIYAVAALAGGSEMLVDTTAQTAVPMLVPREELGKANARLGGTQVLLNDAIGAPVGAFLAGVGAALVFGGSGVLFAVAAVVLRRLHLRTTRPVDASTATDAAEAPDAAGPTDEAPVPIRQQLRDGVQFLTGQPALRRIAVANGVHNFGAVAFVAVFPVFVVGVLDLAPWTFGWFLAAIAVGGVLGAVASDALLQRLGLGRLVRITSLLVSLTIAAIGVTANAAVTAVGFVLIGACGMLWNVGVRVLRQELVPEALLGRVTATMAFVALVAAPLGGLVGGLVAEAFGLRWPIALSVASLLTARLLLQGLRVEVPSTPVDESTAPR